jgi:phytoene dehydrogenase-like protein
VLEQAPRPGGATTSVQNTLPGFVHDHCAAFVPMTVASPAMRELELERDGLEWINPPSVVAHPFADGTAIALHRDVAQTVDSLGAAGAGWAAAMEQVLPLASLLARLLPTGALPGRLHRRLRIWRYGTAPFKVDYALSGPVPWTAPEARASAVVHVAGELEELTRAADEARRGEVPEHPALVVGQQSLHDATRVPAGKHSLYVYSHVPSRYALEDQAVAERIEAQLERFAPGFSSLVLARSTRSPEQTERENPSLVGGDLAGGSYEIDQQLIFRPSLQLSRYRSPLRGLYVAGASTHPGGAVHGMSGRGAAHALLRDRRLRRA